MAVLIVPPLDLTFPTLGPVLADFIEELCVFGPGSLAGQPAVLDKEKRAALYRLYEVFPQGHPLAGRRRFQRGGIEWRKGTAKTEFAAWVAFCELHPDAPVRCDGFDANGDPVGRPVRFPYIPMMAVTEEQVSELAYGVLKYVCEHSPDADLFDAGLERILRKGPDGAADGQAVPVSNAPGARDGALTTFQHFDEPHRLYLPNAKAAHETMVQNLGKRALEDPWGLYTSTAGKPGQGSIEEDLRQEAEAIARGEDDDPTMFFFARWAGPEHDDLSTVDNRVAAIAEATGPVGEYGPGQFLRIAKDWDRKGCDRAYWERVFLNRWRKSGDRAFDANRITDLSEDQRIPDGAFVTLGFDGARFRDCTALVVTDIATGLQQCVGSWQRPLDAAGWEVPEHEVTELVEDVMGRFEVWRAYCDPPHWTETVGAWAARWPNQVEEWWTNRPKYMAYAIREYIEAMDAGLVTFGGTPAQLADLVDHLENAGRKDLNLLDDEGVPLFVLCKPDGRNDMKIDRAMAAVLSWKACLDARKAGAKPRPKVRAPRRLY
ncbi:large terminase [Nocardia sp. CC227C]|uniref:large terminase n=1 Tax=Nocardia sp. CC227C TaxID=3044562 RepID=UPI00278C2862|nr:large terminase [Nocardia sp. CC227C]